jgi:hypothetical protein
MGMAQAAGRKRSVGYTVSVWTKKGTQQTKMSELNAAEQLMLDGRQTAKWAK